MNEQVGHYTVLARRFRPQRFNEVVGQQHVAQSLQNAIRAGRVAHAYLFTGARGVGKTSMARILAKSLNCPHVKNAVPCNECDVCTGIAAGNEVDVLEIDGASNRGIDDIRSLRANVNVKSMRSRYKIYIIDEVHMLTKEAFNALLKTLEEPPETVKFVFCTTEPTKVPDTILSRCQRFDFAAVHTDSIVERLRQIAQQENVDVEPAALEMLGRRATGSMRDSQSLFDQVLAFGGDRVTAEDVHRLLGTANDERLLELMETVLARSRESALKRLDEALAEGVQLGELVDQLVNYLRDLMILASGAADVALLSVAESHRATLNQQAETWGLQTILAALEILAETKSRISRVPYGRALAELALVRLTLLEDLQKLDSLIAGLQGQDGAENSDRGQTASSPRRGTSAGQHSPKANAPARNSAAKKKIDEQAEDGNNAGPSGESRKESPATFSPGNEREFWAQVVSKIDDMLESHARMVTRVAISGPNQLALSFPKSYHFSKQYCQRPEVLSRLEKLAGEVAGHPVQITIDLAEDDEEPAGEERPAATEPHEAPEAGEDSFLRQVQSVFGATVVKVDPLSPRSSQEE